MQVYLLSVIDGIHLCADAAEQPSGELIQGLDLSTLLAQFANQSAGSQSAG
jgi:hypothetical protein